MASTVGSSESPGPLATAEQQNHTQQPRQQLVIGNASSLTKLIIALLPMQP